MREGPPAAPLSNADTERALAALERWAAERDRPVIVLAGEAKAGKTVLLDVFASRLGRHYSVVYLSGPGSDPDTLSARILAVLDGPADGTPRLVLAREVERRTARPLVLLLDDADTLPPRVELWLFDLARRSAGALRVVLALTDARLGRELAAAFRSDTEIVSIGASMGRAEAESYLRLVEARASEAPPAPIRRRADAGGAIRPEQTARPAPTPAPTPSRSEFSAPERSDPVPALAPVAGPRPTPPVPAPRPVAAPLPPPPPRATAAPLPALDDVPAADAAPAERTGPPLRWIALAAALVVSFVAGYVLSELGGEPAPAPAEIADTRSPAELPSVSAPPPATSPTEPTPPPSAVAEPPTGFETPVPDEGVGGALPVARPDPFAPPALLRAEPPLEERSAGAEVEWSPVESGRAETEPRVAAEADPSEAGTMQPGRLDPAEGRSAGESARADTTARAPVATTAAATPTPPAEPEAGTDAPATADTPGAEPAPVAAIPAVRAPPPTRPRTVAVQVKAEPGTEIRIGGRALGVAPVESVALPPGLHRLVVRTPDGREVERIVEVSGTRYEIQVR